MDDLLNGVETLGLVEGTSLDSLPVEKKCRCVDVRMQDAHWDVPAVVIRHVAVNDYPAVLHKLRKGALLLVIVEAHEDQLVSSLKLAGFVEVHRCGPCVVARRPNYDFGVSVPLNTSSSVAARHVEDVWLASARTSVDGDKDDADFIDDDEALLEPGDYAKPSSTLESTAKDRGPTVTTKKACKNCTCGLAEQEATSANVAPSQPSSCGSCYLGDAFRCGGCPYRGLPSFKPGEPILLNSSSFMDPDL